MMNFYQFFDKLNGKPYENGTPPPVKYDFLDYVQSITNTPVNGTENGTSDFMPLTPEQMGQASAEDVAANYVKLHKGKNPLALGKSMTDDDLKKFYGQTW